MTKKVEAPGARKLEKEPDSNIIRPGVTTRAEVIEKFHAVDVGLKSERLFIALGALCYRSSWQPPMGCPQSNCRVR